MSETDPDAAMCLSCGRYSRDMFCPWCGYPTEHYYEYARQRIMRRDSRYPATRKGHSKPQGKRPDE